jgi:hypothetical protein
MCICSNRPSAPIGQLSNPFKSPCLQVMQPPMLPSFPWRIAICGRENLQFFWLDLRWMWAFSTRFMVLQLFRPRNPSSSRRVTVWKIQQQWRPEPVWDPIDIQYVICLLNIIGSGGTPPLIINQSIQHHSTSKKRTCKNLDVPSQELWSL